MPGILSFVLLVDKDSRPWQKVYMEASMLGGEVQVHESRLPRLRLAKCSDVNDQLFTAR